MPNKMHKLIIKRSRWVNGSNNDGIALDKRYKSYKGSSQLLNQSNNMCCLGFLARSCGLGTKHIKTFGEPSDSINNAKTDRIGLNIFNKIKETPYGKLMDKFEEDDDVWYEDKKLPLL